MDLRGAVKRDSISTLEAEASYRQAVLGHKRAGWRGEYLFITVNGRIIIVRAPNNMRAL